MKPPRPFLAVFFLATCALHAHGDLHEFITALTAQLAKDPGDVATRLRLAEMHRLHADRTAAERLLAPLDATESPPAGLHRVRAHLAEDAGEFSAALTHAQRSSAAAPNDGEGHALRARLLSKLERWPEAAAAWGEAIRSTREPDATTFLARATALEKSGDRAGALDGLLAGIARHPREIALRERHAALLHAAGDLDRARESLHELRALYPALALRWWQREGDWLRAAGRREEARAAYRTGLDAAQTLPPRQRHTAATRAMVTTLEGHLAECTKVRDRD
jgi:tetratricopeptide (TPR) repeat protein